ncbi:hypothetical protein FLBR109950_08825 [Flavobacterium branchiophilum]
MYIWYYCIAIFEAATFGIFTQGQFPPYATIFLFLKKKQKGFPLQSGLYGSYSLCNLYNLHPTSIDFKTLNFVIILILISYLCKN